MPRTSRIAVRAALFLVLSACTTHAPQPDRPLEAALTTPTDADLTWHDDRPGVAGHVLEFATEEDGPYTVLPYLPRQVTAYRHPDLLPHTTFHYRLRSYRGPTSAPGMNRSRCSTRTSPRPSRPPCPVRNAPPTGSGPSSSVSSPTWCG
ncbi:hypothetical protein QQY66_02590 [Streptomyces sp. DG2A-72]|uniref:hypothetical protein n=1 Tax=Streptomyces sp. DG2A-72 TaxID=3051386 RepID=UPI00265BD81D|nr:hypothetical protein [Streptomyces sp. DG2A-72]MDO0930624.1 hypothetical protein [Streptomyces sp. DG2A-72]